MIERSNIKCFLNILFVGFVFLVISSFIYQWIMNTTPGNFKEALFYPILSARDGYYLAPMTSFVLAGLIMIACVFMWIGKVYRFIGLQIIYALFAVTAASMITVIIYGYLFEQLGSFIPSPKYILAAIELNRKLQDNDLFFASLIGFGLVGVLYGAYIFKEFFYLGRELGKARFANGLDIHNAKLFSETGFVLAKSFYGKLKFPSCEPIIFVSGTGGGKTSSVVIPNMFELINENIVVTDIKGEIYEKTHQYRMAIGNKIYRFEPGSSDTHRYNPLGLVRKEHLDEDLDIIFKTLIPDSHDPIWADGSRSIAKMMAMYEILEMEKTPTLQSIYRSISNRSFLVNIPTMYEHVKNERVRNLVGRFMLVRDKAKSDLLMSAQEYLSKFDSSNLAYATSSNDFDFRDLRKTATTIYLVMPANTETFGPIFSIFFEQMIQLTTEKNEPDGDEYTINAIIDEFANLPKMPSISKGISFLRSYRIRVCAFVQQISQLKEVYGDNRKESFVSSPVKVAFNVTSKLDAEYFSGLAGEKTLKVSNETIHQDLTMNVSSNRQYQKLISPDEIMRLENKIILIYCAGAHVIKAKKNFWFESYKFNCF